MMHHTLMQNTNCKIHIFVWQSSGESRELVRWQARREISHIEILTFTDLGPTRMMNASVGAQLLCYQNGAYIFVFTHVFVEQIVPGSHLNTSAKAWPSTQSFCSLGLKMQQKDLFVQLS